MMARGQIRCRYSAIHLMARILFCLAAILCAGQLQARAGAQADGQVKVPHSSSDKVATAEERTSRALLAARDNPLELHAFLADMPKGGELHYHLAGGVYAETLIGDAVDDHLCVNLTTLAFVAPTSEESPASPATCASGDVLASRSYSDSNFYTALIDALSMRGFVPSAGVTAHDHFFDTFPKSAIISGHTGEWLDEVAQRAAAQNEQYMEIIMLTPDFSRTAAIAHDLGWRENRSLAEFRDQLLARGLRNDLAAVKAYLDAGEKGRAEREHCGAADASAACKVEIKFIYQVLRANPPEQVFAQSVLGFEAAAADPRIVAINYVQPEDNRIAMADYSLHMKFVGLLHGLYPKVHITLHAGELAPGLVPPDGLCCHIRLAVEEAHAERIGHGVDVMYEDRPYDLLKEMAAKHVMVEINLTSNDVILGVTGKDHPFPIYRKFGVPVALSTDDEGVSRIDLTHEYVRAVQTYGLTYADLKKMVRTVIEHSFLPGASLWRDGDSNSFAHAASSCSQDAPGAAKPSAPCAAFLQSSEKAAQQWELERRFTVFEARH
jgi:adenosine deaminase